jgi:hypothetical protein
MKKIVSILGILFFVFILSPLVVAGDKFDEASLYKAAKKRR